MTTSHINSTKPRTQSQKIPEDNEAKLAQPQKPDTNLAKEFSELKKKISEFDKGHARFIRQLNENVDKNQKTSNVEALINTKEEMEKQIYASLLRIKDELSIIRSFKKIRELSPETMELIEDIREEQNIVLDILSGKVKLSKYDIDVLAKEALFKCPALSLWRPNWKGTKDKEKIQLGHLARIEYRNDKGRKLERNERLDEWMKRILQSSGIKELPLALIDKVNDQNLKQAIIVFNCRNGRIPQIT